MTILSVDAESDGLYGDIFAIGAVVYDPAQGIIAQFGGKAKEWRVENEWVRENVLPVLTDLHTYSGRWQLRRAFWEFYRTYVNDDYQEEHGKTIVLADFGAPVEANLFRCCIRDNPADRTGQAPYPLHELGTALLLAGADPDIDRMEYANVAPGDATKHNPVDDAYVALACWLRATTTLALLTSGTL